MFLRSVEELIVQAGEGRQAIAEATEGYANGTLSSAEASRLIQSVIDNRQAVLDQLNKLHAPPGDDARACLTAFEKAMQASIRADYHYQDWVNGTGSQGAAAPDDASAGSWKRTFVDTYDRLAKLHGLRHDWTKDDL